MLVAVLHGWATVTLGHHTSSAGLVQPNYGMASWAISFQFCPAQRPALPYDRRGWPDRAI
jgi:hypothetical protein